MLISGGLIVLGLLAVVGAFFLARSGERANAAHHVAANQEADTTYKPTLTAPKEDKVSATIVSEERDVALLSGQVDELTEQLQSLQQRLSQLSDVVEPEENNDGENTSFDDATMSSIANEK